MPETIDEPVDQLQALFGAPKPLEICFLAVLGGILAGEGPGRRALPALAAVLGASLLGSCPGVEAAQAEYSKGGLPSMDFGVRSCFSRLLM